MHRITEWRVNVFMSRWSMFLCVLSTESFTFIFLLRFANTSTLAKQDFCQENTDIKTPDPYQTIFI